MIGECVYSAVIREIGKLELVEIKEYEIRLYGRYIDGYIPIGSKHSRDNGIQAIDAIEEQLNRLVWIHKSIDRTYANLIAYSKSLLMNEPKPMYKNEWNRENDTAIMLKAWEKDLLSGIDDGALRQYVTNTLGIV